MEPTKYEQVLKAVQAACPELMDGGYVDCPVRLSHVLRAIGERLKGDTDHRLTMTTDGLMFWEGEETGGDGMFSHWIWVDDAKYDLTKDDLSAQSEETINFLFDILCK